MTLDRQRPKPRQRILVVDVGGTNVKTLATGETTPIRIPSGPDLTPEAMVPAVRDAVSGWQFDAISMGYPGPVVNGKIAVEPRNLGGGWVDFDFEAAFERPVRVLNDAAMQALGGYDGGRMLFLGLGTGLGSALVVEGHIQPLEIAHLPYRHGRSFEDYIGEGGRKRMGSHKWRRHVVDVVNQLFEAMQTESLLIGGGNARRIDKVRHELPATTRVGSNADAFRGGFRLWLAPEERVLLEPPLEPHPSIQEPVPDPDSSAGVDAAPAT